MERHGHIVPLPSNLREDCGGPGACPVCRWELDDLARRLSEAVRPVLETSPFAQGPGAAVSAAKVRIQEAFGEYLAGVTG